MCPPKANKLRVTYGVNGESKCYLVMFNKQKTVADFLDMVRERQEMDDLCAVWLDGVKLPEDEMFEDYWNGTAVFQVTTDPDQPPMGADMGGGMDEEADAGPDGDADVPRMEEPPEMARFNEENITRSTARRTRRINAVKYTYSVVTNVTVRSLEDGDDMDIYHDATPEDVKRDVMDMITSWGVDLPVDIELHLFLPGGLPFVSGTMMDWYDASDVSTHRLYVIVTRPLGELVNRAIPELCDCSSRDMKRLLCPLYDATEQGYAEMACLLGYMQHGGVKTEHILMALAKVTRFAPLIGSIFRIMEGEEVIGLNVIAITAVLHTLFKAITSEEIPDNQLLNYTLKLASVIIYLRDVEMLNLTIGDWSEETTQRDQIGFYCKERNLQRHYVIWDDDTKEDGGFVGYNIVNVEPDTYNTVFNTIAVLKPLSPATAHYLFSAAILNGGGNVWLFLSEVYGRKNWIRYINPTRPGVQEGNIDEIARAVGDTYIDDAVNTVEMAHVDQIIEVCFDESRSMIKKLDGHATRGKEEESRARISTSFLEALMNRSYMYRVASVFGLISFNEEVTEKSALSPLTSDLVNAMGMIHPSGQTHLWDAIDRACNNIIDFNEHEDEVMHPNATQRILVISDGEDSKSEISPVVLVNKLLRKNIIVDSVLVSTSDDNVELAVLCKMTGGLAFRVSSLESGLQLFEQEAFLNTHVRKTQRIAGAERLADGADPVTEAMWEREVSRFNEATDYDREAINQAVREGNMGFPVGSPLHIAYAARNIKNRNSRAARIIREIKYIAKRPSDDVEVWINESKYEKWRVFIKGPDGSPFANKWWSLYVIFPPQYPAAPPVVRFMSVPYHPNVSCEGRILYEKLDVGYHTGITMHEIISDIRQLLAEPDMTAPIQGEIAREYDTNRALYNRKAAGSCDNAMDKVTDYDCMNVRLNTDVPDEYTVDDDANIDMLTVTRTKAEARLLEVMADDDEEF